MMELAGSWFLKLAAWAAPFLARRLYSQSKLTSKIRIRVRGEGDGVVFNCGEMPYARVWLNVANFSPIDVEFDRIFGEISHGSQLAPFYNLHRHLVDATGEKVIFLEIPLNQDHVTFLRRNRNNNFQTTLNFSAVILSSVHNFELPRRELQAGNVQFQNVPP